MKVSEIGLGCGGFKRETIKELFDLAEKEGVNYFDLFSADSETRDIVGEAIKGRRDKFYIQAHICSTWQNGQQVRSHELEKVKEAFDDLLERLGTDYIDVGTIHFVDSVSDWEKIRDGGILDYIHELKREGKIRHIGLGSHNPEAAIKAVRSGEIEVLMFSINPFYDLMPGSEDVNELFDKSNYQRQFNNMDPKRHELYELCQKRGVGITVMKAFGGGRILDPERSHVGKALTIPQALSYCLTRPAVASVLIGTKNAKELEECLDYESAGPKEKDYASALSGISNISWSGECMYCSHCSPCPVKIDVASVIKYLDLTSKDTIPPTVREHYKVLESHASDCIECRGCETRCPFGVEIVEKMKQAKERFGY